MEEAQEVSEVMSIESASSVVEVPYGISDTTSMVQAMDYFYNGEDPGSYPILIQDRFDNQHGEIYPRFRVWFSTSWTQKEMDELQAQLDALPLDSVLRPGFAKFVWMVQNTWTAPTPEEPIIEEPPPTPPGFPGF